MNLIKSATIEQKPMRAGAANRSLIVVGDPNALFHVRISRSSDTKIYDFTLNSFQTAVTSQSRLKNQSTGEISIAFPAAASGDTYSLQVTADANSNTAFESGKNKLVQTVTFSQRGNSKITFTASGTGITNTALGDSTGSSSDSFTETSAPKVVIDELQLTVPDAASDNGFFITTTEKDLNNGTWDSGALYWQTGNYVANGAGTDATALILDSVDDLFVGMQVAVIAGTAQAELRAITAINTTTKTLTLDGNETWANDNVILFRAYGLRLIKQVIGIGLSLVNPTVRLGQTTASIKTELTSDISEGDDIAVNGTTGIGKGATIRMRGVKKNSETGACVVGGVTNSTTAGSFVLTNGEVEASAAKPVRVKTKIYIDGSSNKVFLSATIGVYKYPLAAQTINVDINKILTKGTAS